MFVSPSIQRTLLGRQPASRPNSPLKRAFNFRPSMNGRMFRTDSFDNVFLLLPVNASQYVTAPNINVVRFG